MDLVHSQTKTDTDFMSRHNALTDKTHISIDVSNSKLIKLKSTQLLIDETSPKLKFPCTDTTTVEYRSPSWQCADTITSERQETMCNSNHCNDRR